MKLLNLILWPYIWVHSVWAASIVWFDSITHPKSVRFYFRYKQVGDKIKWVYVIKGDSNLHKMHEEMLNCLKDRLQQDANIAEIEKLV